MVEVNGVMDRLRGETREHHERAERSAFGAAVMAKEITLSAYQIHLAAHLKIHRVLEETLASSESPGIVSVWHDGLRKVPLLEQDLADLGIDETDVLPPETVEAVGAFAAMVQRLNDQEPESLCGVLYVLEGSTMGGSILRKMIAEALGFTSGHGLNYYSVYGNEVRKHFMDFKSRMSEAYDGSGQEDRLVAAAQETFDLVGDVFRSIPLESGSMQGQAT